MRNIPFFTSEYGVASLVLESIPARHEAFIHLQSSEEPGKLLEECRAFCVACGAERIYAAGHEILNAYPYYMSILRMNGHREAIGETDASLFPVQEKTAERWRQIYNEKMGNVPKAAHMTALAMKKLLEKGNAYFIHRDGVLLGIGVAAGNRIDAVVSVVPGMGAEAVRALCHALSGDVISVEAASTNERAVKLYERLGFVKTKELSRWYQIF